MPMRPAKNVFSSLNAYRAVIKRRLCRPLKSFIKRHVGKQSPQTSPATMPSFDLGDTIRFRRLSVNHTRKESPMKSLYACALVFTILLASVSLLPHLASASTGIQGEAGQEAYTGKQ